jgi:hypothetical protein
VILGGVSPLWHHQGNMLIHDSFLMVALTFSLLIWWQVTKRPNLLGYGLVGISAGVLILCKQTGVFSAFAIGVGLLFSTRSIRALCAYAAGGVLAALPLAVLYNGNYDLLSQGLLGWNLAANAHLPPNPKLAPFINDIFLANPILWGIGGLAAIATLRLLPNTREEKPKSLARVTGLIVFFTLAFNWFLSRQTFGQYYLQAVPPLILLAAWGIDSLIKHPLPKVGRFAVALGFSYLGVLNPLMNTITPWTPDLEDKLAISRWVKEEVEDEMMWEPWVYYAHLAEKDFTFYYPFLSIHSMQNDPSLPFIDGTKFIPLEEYIEENEIQWVITHHPMLPGLQTRLDRMFKAGPDDWQVVQTFRVTRYASEAGMQNHFWTPWWKPEVFFEDVIVWRKHQQPREGGLVGEMVIRNPGDYPYLYLEVQHPGGVDVYHLDVTSAPGQVYEFGWHQTGHALFLSGDPRLIDHQPPADTEGPIIFTITFTNNAQRELQDFFQVRLLRDNEGAFCSQCLEAWRCLHWEKGRGTCEPTDIQDVLKVDADKYEPLN